MNHVLRNTMAMAALALALASLSARADTIRWLLHEDGDWNDSSRWTNTTSGAGSITPGPGDVVDLLYYYTTTTQSVVTLNSTMYPAGVTNASWDFSSYGGPIIERSYLLDAYGTVGAPLAIELTGPSGYYGTLRLSIGREIHLDHVHLTVSDSTAGKNAIVVDGRIGGRDASLTTSNTDILCSSALSGYGMVVAYNGYASSDPQYFGRAHMNGGSLTVTNPTSDAKIMLNGGLAGAGFTLTDDDITALLLSDTLLTADDVTVQYPALLRLDTSGRTETNRISGTLLIDDGGRAEFSGGQFAIGTVEYYPAAGYTGTAVVVNNATGTIGTVTMQERGTSSEPKSFIVSNGVVVIGNISLGGSNPDRGACAFSLAGGSVRVDGSTMLGHEKNDGDNPGSGLLTITGGAFETGDLVVGGFVNTTTRGDGYYEQTGGSATITNILTLYTAIPTYGCAQFVVSTNATMTLTGPGFVKSGTTDWVTNLLTTTNLDFSGTLAFDPAPSVTNQNLLAFGDDLGPVLAAATNFPIGTLDLSGVDGSEQVTVSAAGNFSTNALYVLTLRGVTPANAETVLDSSIVVYYDFRLNMGLSGTTYALDSGGSLMPFNVYALGTVITIR